MERLLLFCGVWIIIVPILFQNSYFEEHKKYKLSKVIGSDTHDSSLEFYSDMKFYEIDSEEIKRIIKIC